MDRFIQYYKDNQLLFYVTLGTLFIAALAIVLIILTRKAREKKNKLDEELNVAARALIEQEAKPEATFDDFVEESKAQTGAPDKTEAQSKPEKVVAAEKEKAEGKKEDSESKTADKTEKAPDNNTADDEQAVTTLSAAEAIIIPQKDNPIILPSGEIKSDKNQEKSANKPIIDQNESAKKDVKEASSRQVVATSEEKQRIIIKADSEQDAPEQASKEDKKEVVKVSQTATNPQQKPKAKYTGKWQIYSENGRYAANLVASNGEVLLRTESYSALSGIKSGIETIKNNIERDNFALSVDKNGNYFFKLFSSSTRLLCISEAYTTKAVCESAINSVKRFSKTAVIEVLKEEDQ